MEQRDEQTIAAISTAMGEAGIGVIRVSGEQSLPLVAGLFVRINQKPWDASCARMLCYGHIVEEQELLDEALVVYMKGPYTYTGEDVVEVQCHGNSISLQRILEALLRRGARLADPGEFTKRAFLNGRLDLTQAEAVMDVVSARSEEAHRIALQQMQGSIGSAIAQYKQQFVEILAELEYSINFMEDAEEERPVEPVKNAMLELVEALQEWLRSSKNSHMLRLGITTVILGRPNAGKSSLLNALSKSERAIVTDIPGTTRDVIEELIRWDGLFLRLVDTAGIHETEDPIEKIGVQRSKSWVEQADLLLWIVDGSTVPTDEDREFYELVTSQREHCILVVNKLDQMQEEIKSWRAFAEERELPVVFLSARYQQGLDDLHAAIRTLFAYDQRSAQDTLLTHTRQKEALQKACEELQQAIDSLGAGMSLDAVEVEVREAYLQLLSLTGESIDEKILDHIFEQFCIGK